MFACLFFKMNNKINCINTGKKRTLVTEKMISINIEFLINNLFKYLIITNFGKYLIKSYLWKAVLFS